MGKFKYFVFDIIYLIFWIISYIVPLLCALYVASLFMVANYYLIALGLVLAYLTFLHTFLFTICFLKIIFQPKLTVGEFNIGMNKDYLGWIFNSLFMGLFEASPFSKQIHFVFYLNWLYYRLMGMKLPVNSLVGMNTTIRQPELIEVGENSIIGLGAIISCHFTANGKIHTQGRVKIGMRSVVGGYAGISPNVEIGDHSVVGARSSIYPNVKIGNNVRIGSSCSIFIGATIPDNVKIKSHTIIDKHCDIKAGETWGGHPARKID